MLIMALVMHGLKHAMATPIFLDSDNLDIAYEH